MITLGQLSAVLALAMMMGIVVGTGLTTRSIDRSFRHLAERRRLLEQRERTVESIIADHRLCLSCPSPASLLREPAYWSADPADDD